MGRTVRLQFEIDPTMMKAFEHLEKLGGMRTHKELFNNALTLLKWSMLQKAHGSSIGSRNERVNPSEFKELDMPIFNAITANAASVIKALTPIPTSDKKKKSKPK